MTKRGFGGDFLRVLGKNLWRWRKVKGYTQEEITQLDEYFTRLRELNQREIEIQNSIAKAITQQASQNAKAFEGSLGEYKVQSQEWLKTAEEQKEKTNQE